MSFWQSKTGATIDGSMEKAFAASFVVIPDGTTAVASIKDFKLIEKAGFESGLPEEFYQIIWKMTDGEFKNREVTQKIKAFDDDVKISERAKNMMRRMYTLSGLEPLHDGPPSNEDLLKFLGKVMGIKIREWQQPKKDGSGFMEGNFVSETHALDSHFKSEVGTKMETPKVVATTSGVESAFSRNAKAAFNDDVPY